MRSRRSRCSTTTLEAVVITASSKGGWRRWVWTWAGAPPGQGIRWRVAPNTLVHLYEGGATSSRGQLGRSESAPHHGAVWEQLPIMSPLARTPHSGANRPSPTHDTAPHHAAVREQHPSWGRSPRRRIQARAARHSCPTMRPVMGPPWSSTHHGAARQDAALWRGPPGTRLGAAPIMGPHARTPHSGPSRPAHTPDSAPHHGAALEQLPSWGRSAIGRTLARAARHSRPQVRPERGGAGPGRGGAGGAGGGAGGGGVGILFI